MKNFKYLLLALLLAGNFQACTDDWDNHYSQHESEVTGSDVEIVDQTLSEYLASHNSYEQMTDLFEECGILERIENSPKLMFNLFVVENSSMGELPADLAQRKFVAETHVSTVSVSPNAMVDGEAIAMWNGKYVQIIKQRVDGGYRILLNESRVLKVIKTNNGYIYVMDERISTPKSLLETLEDLGDEYSIFKDMIFSRQERVFDKENSRIIGVDPTGNTEYDTVWKYSFPYFEDWRNVDLANEEASYTILIPSNDLIDRALFEARANLQEWGIPREDSMLTNWIFQAAIFDTRYNPEDFGDPANPDLNMDITKTLYDETANMNPGKHGGSVFGKQWRTTVNTVDVDNPIEMSNGVAYFVKSLKIPQNVLIYRMKEHIKYSQYFNDEDAQRLRRSSNLVNNANLAWRDESSFEPPGWPIKTATVLWMNWDKVEPTGETMYEVDLYWWDEQTRTCRDFLLPPGEYTFSLGFSQSQKMGSRMEIYLNDQEVKTGTPVEVSGWNINERSGGGFPEFYHYPLTNTHTTYDRDGKEICTYTMTGDKAVPMKLTMRNYFDGTQSSSNVSLHHWCFRPTKNCY